jgi:hypothetical protein
VNATIGARISVEPSMEDSTERENVSVLRELVSGQGEGWSGLLLGWGYNGTGTSAAACSIP